MNLDEILNNSDLLQGLGFAPLADQEALLGAVAQLPVGQRTVAMAKIMKPKDINSDSLTARGAAMSRLGALPAAIRSGLIAKQLQIVDTQFYAVKTPGAATTLRMIVPADVKAPGVTNLNKGQLEKDNYFMLTEIALLSGVDADPKNAAYGVCEKGIINGDFEFTAAGNKYLLPKDTSCQCFDTSNRSDIQKGAWKLDNPKWIEPQADIEFNLRFSQALAVNTNVKVVFIGASIINY